MFAPIIVVLVNLVPKTSVWLGSFPLLPDKLQSLKWIPVIGAYQIGNNNRRRSRYSGMTMHKYIMLLLPLLIDPCDCFIEMLNDGEIEQILDGYDLMAIDDRIDVDF